jgi:glycosyltransferase involved in cell wall biosynthesis
MNPATPPAVPPPARPTANAATPTANAATPPTVSVVLTCRDYAAYVGEAIESVLAQTFTDFELLAIDDGSRDQSVAVISRYLGDRRVRLIECDGVGAPNAKALGTRLARGEFVGLLDADDRWHPTKLARQVEVLRAKPEVAVVATRRALIDAAGQPLPPSRDTLHRGAVASALLMTNFVCYSSALVRRSALEHVGSFDPLMLLAPDYELWLRLARHYDFDYVDEILVDYRRGHASIGRRHPDRRDLVELAMRRAVRERGVADQCSRRYLAACWADLHLGTAEAYARLDARRCYRELARALAYQPTAPNVWRRALRLGARALVESLRLQLR